MQNKFVVGGKYRIKSKSIGDPIKLSRCLERAKEKGQEFLYFCGEHESSFDGRVLLFCDIFEKNSGDYYLPQDVEVYLEKDGKYTPIAKTVGGFGDLEGSNSWKDAQSSNQNFLYYCYEEGSGLHVFSSKPDSDGGDYFNIDDIIPFVPDAEIVTFSQENNSINNQKTETMAKQFTVDADFIKEAHKAACSEWKKKLEKKFPEALKPGAFDFGKSWEITTEGGDDGPLLIGFGYAPNGKEHKCLVVDDGWEMKVSEHEGRQILEFFEKKS